MTCSTSLKGKGEGLDSAITGLSISPLPELASSYALCRMYRCLSFGIWSRCPREVLKTCAIGNLCRGFASMVLPVGREFTLDHDHNPGETVKP